MAPNAGGALASLGNMITRTSKDSTPAFSGGIIGRMGAITKLERRAAKNASSKAVLRGDLNLARIARMNGKGLMANVTRTGMLVDSAVGYAASNVSITATPLAGLVGKTVAGEALTLGERRYMTTMGVNATKSQNFMRTLLTPGGGVEMRTAMGTAGMKTIGTSSIQMTESFFKIANPLTNAFEKSSVLRSRAAGAGVRMSAISGYEAMAVETLEKGILKTVGSKGALSAIKHGGARVGLAVAGEAALAAVPGLNLIFAADMAYQLAKLGGLAVKAGINFGKDGMKSMQGNMHTGVFGAGYKDDEVRATSRARGVAAIQNSRLNARSLLGSEGAMMASHFG
jgi:hypothetical protein